MPKSTMNRYTNNKHPPPSHQERCQRYWNLASNSRKSENGMIMSCLRNSRSPPSTPGSVVITTDPSSSSSSSFHAGAFLTLSPRQVSFEDSSCSPSDNNSNDSDSSFHHCQQHHHRDTTTTTVCSTPSPITRKRSLLTRPKSTMSLVDLAKSAEEKEQQEQGKSSGTAACTDNSSNRNNDNEDSRNQVMVDVELGQPQAKRICSPRAIVAQSISTCSRTPSPTCTDITTIGGQVPWQQNDSSEVTTTTSTTPGSCSFSWGQFVDMLIPEEEEEEATRFGNTPSSSYSMSPHNPWCYHEWSSSRRRRRNQPWCRYRLRSSPYDTCCSPNNKNNHMHRAIISQRPPSTLHLEQYTLPSSSSSSSLSSSNNHNHHHHPSSKFRLTPRKNTSTEKNDHELLIIGALADLNF